MRARFEGGPMDGQELDVGGAKPELYVAVPGEWVGWVGAESDTLPRPAAPLVYVRRKRLPDAPELSPRDPVEVALWRSRAELVYVPA